MKTPQIVRELAHQSVLCWLATADIDGMPNVSPKEIFTFADDKLLIANIMSPQSSHNIKLNKKVCVSFINVITEYGYQIKGKASIAIHGSDMYKQLAPRLDMMTKGKYPYREIFVIKILNIKEVKAPSYILFPEKTIEERVQATRKRYLAI